VVYALRQFEPSWGDDMRARLLAVGGLLGALALAACGGSGGNTVSSASLEPRLLPPSSVPGFGLQRRLDWSDPVNLAVEGMYLPQALHPSAAVTELEHNKLEGGAGEVLATGSGPEATEVRIGVAKLGSDSNAAAEREWMHHQDGQQPCFSQCTFAPQAKTIPAVPAARFVVQSSKPPPLPPGAPKNAKVAPPPANYMAEFTVGPYLYWAFMQADASAQSRFEAGVARYYAHATHAA
jgi:hypothetical protein